MCTPSFVKVFLTIFDVTFCVIISIKLAMDLRKRVIEKQNGQEVTKQRYFHRLYFVYIIKLYQWVIMFIVSKK